MKFLLPVLFIAASVAAQDLRLFKGRAYDLHNAQLAGPSSVYSNYWVSGAINQIYPGCVIISVNSGARLWRFNEARWTRLQSAFGVARSPEPGLLGFIADNRLGKIEVGQRLSRARLLTDAEHSSVAYPELYDPEAVFEAMIVLHYPMNGLRPGMALSVCGLRAGNARLGNDSASHPVFDCGLPYAGETNVWFAATPQGIVSNAVTSNALSFPHP